MPHMQLKFNRLASTSI